MTEDRTNIQTFVVSVFYHYWAKNSVGIYSLLKDPCSNILSVVGVEEKCLLPSDLTWLVPFVPCITLWSKMVLMNKLHTEITFNNEKIW